MKTTQEQLTAKHEEYQRANYASPRDEALCLSLAKECLELAKGSQLEQRFRDTVARHERRLK